MEKLLEQPFERTATKKLNDKSYKHYNQCIHAVGGTTNANNLDNLFQ